MDDGTKKKPNNSNDGSKYGAEPGKDVLRVTKLIPFREPELNVPFMWVYKVNMGPLFVRTHPLQSSLLSVRSQLPGLGLGLGLKIRKRTTYSSQG